VSSLCKEKKSLELELETLHKDHANLVRKYFFIQYCSHIQFWVKSTSKKGAASILEPVDPKLKVSCQIKYLPCTDTEF